MTQDLKDRCFAALHPWTTGTRPVGIDPDVWIRADDAAAALARAIRVASGEGTSLDDRDFTTPQEFQNRALRAVEEGR